MKLHAVIDGSAGAPAVVFLGSLGSTLAMWRPQVAALSGSRRCIRVDHRGHGGTPATAGPYSIADLGGDVLDTLDALDIERTAVVGLSLGGMIAIWLAAHAPERVDATALLCSSAQLGPASAWTERAALVRAGGMPAVAAAVVGRWLTEAYAAAHGEEVAGFLAMVAAADPEGYAGCCEAIAAMDLRADLPRVTAPTIVIAGRFDPATPPEHARDIADGIPGARLVLVDGAHLASWECSAAVNAELLGHLTACTGRPDD